MFLYYFVVSLSAAPIPVIIRQIINDSPKYMLFPLSPANITHINASTIIPKPITSRNVPNPLTIAFNFDMFRVKLP